MDESTQQGQPPTLLAGWASTASSFAFSAATRFKSKESWRLRASGIALAVGDAVRLAGE